MVVLGTTTKAARPSAAAAAANPRTLFLSLKPSLPVSELMFLVLNLTQKIQSILPPQSATPVVTPSMKRRRTPVRPSGSSRLSWIIPPSSQGLLAPMGKPSLKRKGLFVPAPCATSRGEHWTIQTSMLLTATQKLGRGAAV